MTLVVVEHEDPRAERSSIEVVSAAQRLGVPVTVVAVGAGLEGVAARFARLDVSAVIRLEHDLLGDYTSDGYVAALAAFVADLNPSLVFLPHTYRSRDFAPRLAARLNRSLIADCIRIGGSESAPVFTRPIYQGKLVADVVPVGPGPHVVTLQGGAFRADDARLGAGLAPVRLVRAVVTGSDVAQLPEPPFRQAREAIDLTKAERIVAAGRGLKEERHLSLARDLAAALGAELAASRPICDAGWLPMERQVGSSGQTVAPRLYVALGISGAIQHLVGMKGAKTIVAINKDPDAPMFEVAHYGIVGDLFEVIPAMIAALNDGGNTRS